MELQRVYKTSFEMSHIIKDHPVCGVNHGHSYQLVICLNGDSTKWWDFHDIKELVEREIKEKYDHHLDPNTNKIYEISAEELAERFAKYLTDNGLAGSIELWETSKYGIRLNFGELKAGVMQC